MGHDQKSHDVGNGTTFLPAQVSVHQKKGPFMCSLNKLMETWVVQDT